MKIILELCDVQCISFEYKKINEANTSYVIRQTRSGLN